MRNILFKKRIPESSRWSDFIHEGTFHKWGNAFEEFESGVGNYTIAIVEVEGGTIEEVFPTNVKFISN